MSLLPQEATLNDQKGGSMPRQSNKGRTFPAEVLSPDEARRLLSACSKGSTGARNRALLVLCYRAGLRVGEALQLRPEHLDLETGTIRVRAGKRTRKVAGDPKRRSHMARQVAVNPEAAAILAVWMAKRAALPIGPTAPFLCTLRGGRVLPSYARSLMKRLAKAANIDPSRVRPHGLRHCFASELAREGVPMTVIQGALGHRSILTTSRYGQDVAPEHVLSTLRARSWA